MESPVLWITPSLTFCTEPVKAGKGLIIKAFCLSRRMQLLFVVGVFAWDPELQDGSGHLLRLPAGVRGFLLGLSCLVPG